MVYSYICLKKSQQNDKISFPFLWTNFFFFFLFKEVIKPAFSLLTYSNQSTELYFQITKDLKFSNGVSALMI